MKAKTICTLGLFLCFGLFGAWANAEPRLNGLAVSSEFGKERFIAALYTNNRSTREEDLFNNSFHRRMELKVTADSLSARSINSMWVEGMAINNPSAALEAEAENLAALNNMVRRRLRAGDVLSFDAAPGQGMTVHLNGVQLGHIKSTDFFNMMLRTWIGSIPLSTEFKNGLLAGGDLDAGLAGRYATIEPAPERVAAVEGWLDSAPASSSPRSGIAPPRPDVDIAPPPVAVAPAPAPTPAPARPAPEPARTPAPPPVAAAPAPRPAPPPAPAPVDDDGEDAEEVMVTAESLIVRQRYISDVLRQTLQNMRYPRRAQERSQQGSIRLAVTVKRNGEVESVQVVEESAYSLLNREAVASVERASPFPAIPDAITGESLTFAIPVTFRLQ